MDFSPNTERDRGEMLSAIGLRSAEALFGDVPKGARLGRAIDLPPPLSEPELVEELSAASGRDPASRGEVSFLGAGSYNHFIPSIVPHLAGRSEFYTAYTPYQPEVSQGVLQVIYEYQTMVCSITKMDAANASMYDGATALAEALSLAVHHTGRKRVLLSGGVHPEYRSVVRTYADYAGWEIADVPLSSGRLDVSAVKASLSEDVACLALAQPNFFGCIEDGLDEISKAVHLNGSLLLISVDPISLGLLKAPGDLGADIATGEGSCLGSPRSFGGPGLGLFAVRSPLLRRLPGRLSGATVDHEGRRGFVLTLQAREQHIRREKASSNICSNEALLALRAAIYLSAMGKEGLRQVASQCAQKAAYAKTALGGVRGYSVKFGAPSFKEFVLSCPVPASRVNKALLGKGMVGGLPLDRFFPDMKNDMLLCFTELTKRSDIDRLARALKDIK